MARRTSGRVRTEYGPQASYAYAVVDALLDIKTTAKDHSDGGLAYHAAVNHFLALTAADTGYYSKAWETWQRRVFAGPDGSVPRSLSRAHRRVEVAMAMKILRKSGAFGYKEKPFSDDAAEIAALLGVDKEDVEDDLLEDEELG